MAFSTLKFRLTGSGPMLMHNADVLVDPLSEISKAMKKVSGKRKKTDADHEELARLEFLGGLYLDQNQEPCLPAKCIKATLVRGATVTKDGTTAKKGCVVVSNSPLQYDGPRTPKDLWADDRFRDRRPAKVGQSTVMRTRPMFDKWAADIEIDIDTEVIEPEHVEQWLKTAGRMVGVGDYRVEKGGPFGRFTVEKA